MTNAPCDRCPSSEKISRFIPALLPCHCRSSSTSLVRLSEERLNVLSTVLILMLRKVIWVAGLAVAGGNWEHVWSPNCSASWHINELLLAVMWRGRIFMGTTLPFGLHSAPTIFMAVADSLAWAIRCNWVMYFIHYLDDFLYFCGSSEVHN